MEYTFHMESDVTRPEQTKRASAQMRVYRRLRSPDGALRPARQYWTVMLWSAALTAAYIGVFLAGFAGGAAAEVAGRPGGASSAALILAPMLIFSSLIQGTRERFRIRSRPSVLQLLLAGAGIAGFLALGALSLTAVAYPWWWNILVPLGVFAAMAMSPIRGLITTPSDASESWPNAPLGTSVRVVTGAIGLGLGLLLAASAMPLAAALMSLVVMVLSVAILLAWRSRFGLPRVGYEWGPGHWAGFGACVTVMFLHSALLTYAPWFTAGHAIATGILVTIIMGTAALLPRTSRVAP